MHRNKELWTKPHFTAIKKLFCLRQNVFVKTNSYVTVENRKKPGQWIAKCVAKCSHYIRFLWVQYCKFHPQAAGLLGTILRGVLLKSMGLLFLEVTARRGCYRADTSPLTQPPADQQPGKSFSHYVLAWRMEVWVFCNGMGLIGNIYSIIWHNIGIDKSSLRFLPLWPGGKPALCLRFTHRCEFRHESKAVWQTRLFSLVVSSYGHSLKLEKITAEIPKLSLANGWWRENALLIPAGN